MPTDTRRRRELREFLLAMRSLLQPADVGLPATARRRVPGLRREEVSELLGVSPVWYRWFESGRPVRVSEQFISRLSTVLRLDASSEVTLYRLALPGLYRAEAALREAMALRGGEHSPNASFSSRRGIELAARGFATAREQFLLRQTGAANAVRPRVVRSWERSQSLGVDPGCRVAPRAARRDHELHEMQETNERLLRASERATSHLTDRLSETGYAVAVTDARGCLLRVSGDAPVRRRLMKIGFESGGDWSERAAGTNAIGTAIADGRPFQLMGAEHFCAGWAGFTCTAAPIREPATAKVIGVLDVTADYRQVRPHLVGLITDYALEIEHALGELS